MPEIPALDAASAPELLSAALDEHGCLVLQNAVTTDLLDQVRQELEPYLERAQAASDVPDEDFYPGHTKRVTALIRKSESYHNLVRHPVLLGLCDDLLLPNCERYHVHVTSALVVGPGARSQVLHREDDTFPYFQVPRPDLIIASMTAVTDFKAENGATLMVPGSHRWEADREPVEHEILQAEMSAGDTLVWMGGTLHGAGANVINDWRYGLFLSYSLGWLRQEENQYLDVPRSVADNISEDIRDLVGYKMHTGLGFYDIAQD